ncbi:biotin transporter BioY [Paenibacillus crassostreae]|uniref:Biotin transporter n=1 Tax=Paenibacillus crassostreae TaxID=1763538 RepID=A0A167FAK9_9BACL|nr:biotin transporter BioY [Paenibacillus crassostreae]AOZ90879.1 biotin transporter BioY [Paenibacillus crassostreae]OAB76355.1 biotin biosynthesis protein BioY [Paenibacillus crassostreae]
MKTKEMVYAALFAALIGVLGMIPPIPLGFIPVPVTAQTLGVMLAGCFLGKKTGTISLILFIVLVALGLPLLSGGRGGLSVFVGPTIGYFLSWPVAVFCIGYMTEKVWSSLKTWKLIAINIVGGVVLISLIGAPVMAMITHTSVWAGLVGAIAFLPGDCIKAIIAAVIVTQLKSVSPIEQNAHNR